MIIHRKLSKMKNKILPTCYGNNFGEFSNTSYGVVRAERVIKIAIPYTATASLTRKRKTINKTTVTKACLQYR